MSHGSKRPSGAKEGHGWGIYILRCADGSLYTGATNDLERRVARHQAGKGAAYTRSRLPVTLVFHQRAEDRGGALRAEAALKRLRRSEKLALISSQTQTQMQTRAKKSLLAAKARQKPEAKRAKPAR